MSLTLSLNGLILIVLIFALACVFSAPSSLVLAFSNRIPSRLPWVASAHDALVKRVLEESLAVARDWSEATTRQVGCLARKKLQGQLAQIQAVTPTLGVLGLLALFPLVLP